MPAKKFYNYDEIKSAADCAEIAKTLLSLPVGPDGRCPAAWRGGNNPTSISIGRDGWHDFGTGEGGSVIDLVALVKFSGDIHSAQELLGEYLNLTPIIGHDGQEKRRSRADSLKERGYSLTETYEYRDENGIVRHAVERWEHPEHKKEFVQRGPDPDSYGIKGIKTLLYRLNEWKDSQNVCLCEGEKDANTLISMGYHATTNNSGAGNWDPSYTEMLRGKNVAIFIDNDEAGRMREEFLAWELRDAADKIRIVRFDGEADGFDVTDYYNKYGPDKLVEHIKNSPILDKNIITSPADDMLAISKAKEANRYNLRNYYEHREADDTIKFVAKKAHEIIEDFNLRFLGFPRRVGAFCLFDHNRDTGEIEFLRNSEALFAWAARKSKRLIEWKSGHGFVPKKEFYHTIEQESKRYEEISYAPSWPARQDVYYAHPQLPPPDPEHRYFHRFVDMFHLESVSSKIVVQSLIASPLWFIPGVPRPSYVIDSNVGRGSGKTTIPEMVAKLYNSSVLETTLGQLRRNYDEFAKRVVSQEGRKKRIVLADNVTGRFESPEWAQLITADSISGRPAYGYGEESRPNNLVYVITANSAIVDPDIASRSLYAFTARPDYNDTWKQELLEMITNDRYRIIADIIDILESHQPFDNSACTRFPEFETNVLQAFCGDLGSYDEVIKFIKNASAESNLDTEYIGRIRDTISATLLDLGIGDEESVFFRTDAIEDMFAHQKFYDGTIPQLIRDLAKQGSLEEVDLRYGLWPHHDSEKCPRRRGIMWKFSKARATRIVGIDRRGKLAEIHSL